jgi:hypothetical protein
MAGTCDRCNERTSQIMSIGPLPELRPIMHLGYRHVCMDCYDDLLAEAREPVETVDDEEGVSRVDVSIPARVEGTTKHFEPFSDEMTIEEIGRTDLWLRTSRDLDPGSLVKVIVASYDLEFAAIVESVSTATDRTGIELKLAEQSDGWEQLYCDKSQGEESGGPRG